MNKLLLTRYADLVRYDAVDALLQVIQFEPPWQLGPVADLEMALAKLAALDLQAGLFGAGYALAVAAHTWRGRPTDAQRGAIIQAAQRIRSIGFSDPTNLLGRALEQADAALLVGDDAEPRIVTLISEQMRRADRAVDRCGRRAAALLDPADQVFVYGFGGPPLLALLGALPALDPTPVLRIAGSGVGPQMLADLAGTAGFTARLTSDGELFLPELPGLCLVTAQVVGADGGAICPIGSGPLIASARQRGIPCYVLGPSGPSDKQTAAIELASGGDSVLPELISAIITDRGIYRPAMIHRYHGDADTPLDVIPLN